MRLRSIGRTLARRKIAHWVGIAILITGLLVMTPEHAGAGDLISRSVIIGSSQPSVVTTHTFGFTLSTAGTVGSLDFEYCTNSPFVGLACTAPNGLDTSTVGMTSQSGMTGFVIDPLTSGNRIVISRAPSATPIVTANYIFDNITNPSDVATTVFVRIATYASNDATGSRTDIGAVAFSTTRSVSTTGFVPPYLVFCVGVTVSADCSVTTGNYINLGILRSTQANTGTSQMNVFTNDGTGFVVTVAGSTMTSGTNIIPALATPTFSAPGNSQFGINLRDNTSPDTGFDPVGVGSGAPAPNYGIADNFMFQNGDIVSSSPFPTEANVMTVTYLVNVSAGQPPGVYVTTMTYIATVSF